MAQRIQALDSFLWLYNIPLCGSFTFSVFILQWIDTWVVTSFALLCKMLLWTFLYKFSYEPMLFYSLRYIPGNATAGSFCDPMDCSSPGFSVPGISQARILKWVAISFSRGSSQPRDLTQVSCISRRMLYWATMGVPGTTTPTVILCLAFSGITKLFSRAAAPFYVSIGNVWES